MFRKGYKNQDLNEQKQRYMEQEQQAELTHAALFSEVDHLRDICTLLLNNLPNCCVRSDMVRYNITRLRKDGPTRILISDEQYFVDCSIDTDYIDIAEGERRTGQQADYTTQQVVYRHKPMPQLATSVVTYTNRFASLQEELLVAAGYIESAKIDSSPSDAVGSVAVRSIAA